MKAREKEKLKDTINALKKKKGAIILAHSYQQEDIYDIADFVGDSYELSVKAMHCQESTIVFCGVKFMAETAKILSPEKTVLLPAEKAGCPMADMITLDQLKNFKAKYPGVPVVSYVNTNADVKTETDICCTSANAAKVVDSVQGDRVLFVPDKNLAGFIAQRTEKEIIPWNGFCKIHHRITPEMIREAKSNHPDAVVIGHPECKVEVSELFDYALSTGGMVKYAQENSNKKIILVTVDNMANRLRRENPSNKYITLGMVCQDMQMTDLNSVLNALEKGQHEVKLDHETIGKAKTAMERMVEIR
ncbi:MAG: quinolinate synthase NadA [Candidatus Electrothrix sp. AW5]|nr:quinolinate synthase NadA [Candidatus Electrothrix gigas]